MVLGLLIFSASQVFALTTSSVISKGATGSTVTAIQYALNTFGSTLTTDGKFGTNTETAVVAFQTSNSLPATGIVDSATLTALHSTSSKPITTTVLTGATSTIVTSSKTTPCISTTSPWIKVTSPNGGESFTVGQQIAINWISCNIPTTTKFNVTVLNSNFNNNLTDDFDFFHLPAGSVSNTGSTSLTIPNINASGMASFPAHSGQATYKVRISKFGDESINDFSDNNFTINGTTLTKPIPQTNCDDSSIPVKLIMTGVDGGGNSDPISTGSQKITLGRFILYPTCNLKIDKFEIYNTSYFASQGFSKYYIHLGWNTNQNNQSTGTIIGEISSGQNMGGDGNIKSTDKSYS